MLTSDLVRVRVRGKEIQPSLVEPEKLLEDAADLRALFDTAVEERWTRGQLEEEVADRVADRRDHKVVRGLVKVMLDRSRFDVEAPLPPPEVRDRVFRASRRAGALALERGPLGRPIAEDVLAQVGEELGLDADQVADLLYADLAEEQRIRDCTAGDAAWVVSRYNLALVQAVLLKATEVKVRLVGPSAPRLRQLFRYVKFHQLMHEARRDGDAVEIVLDGPGSLFKQSTRYGMQLATFLPALALQECHWSLEATVLWTRSRHRKRMFVTDADGLQSHYKDVGAYETRMQTWFAERFAALECDWALDDATLPIDLGGRALVLPDFRFKRGRKTAYLEIVGFWRRDYLERRMALLARYAPANLILAVSRKLLTDKAAELPPNIVSFAEIVPARKVLERIEEVAT